MSANFFTFGVFQCQAVMMWMVALPAVAAAADVPPLPFTIKVTEQKIDPLPDYMGPNNKVDMDFPFCPVVIDGEFWIIYKNGYTGPVLRYKGTNMENAVRQRDGAASFPIRGGYILGGIWYDQETKTLYAPLHCEVATYPSNIRREIHLASSTDKGLTWKYLGPIITNPPGIDLKTSPDAESGLLWDGGNGDHIIYVDERGGYIYLYSNHDMWPKFGSPAITMTDNRVARCAIADKMAPGKWQRFYQSGWTEPGLEGKSSRVDGDVVAYNTYLKKYLSFGGASSLSMCDDLSKQDWTPYHQIGPFWSSSALWAVWPTNETKSDTRTIGKNFFVYNFWQAAPGRLFQCTLGEGTLPTNGLAVSWRSGRIGNEYGGDAAPDYGYYPLYESDDPIFARHTRRVDLDHKENTYAGTWSDATGDLYYLGHARASSTKGDNVSLTFTGQEIYWHGVRAPDLGKADIYIDDVLQGTVDCWASTNDPLSMTFMKRGLKNGPHTIKVIVKGEKNPLSSGTAIKHMLFEYSADSYRSSDGFSSIAGKNHWINQERAGNTLADMAYVTPMWQGAQGSKIGFTEMTPAGGAAIRKWIAPHDGTVRLEGAPTLAGSNSSGVDVTILKGDDKVWSAHLTTPVPASYDTTMQVKSGDELQFVSEKTSASPDPGPGLEVNDKSALQLNARDGKPMKIGTAKFTRGLAIGKTDQIIVHLPRPGVQLAATIGLDTAASPGSKGDFSVSDGDRELFRPDPHQKRPNGWEISLDLNGATDLTLHGGDGIDWANAKVTTVEEGKDIWLADLPIQGPRTGTSTVTWDPVITYTR